MTNQETLTTMIHSDHDTGLNTTKGMWEMLSDILGNNEEKLPNSLNEVNDLID